MEVLNEKVKQLRLERNWTQQHLADACDVSLRTIQRIEKYGNASYESVMSLCAVLEITKNDICVVPKVAVEEMQEIKILRPLVLIIPSLLIGAVLGAFMVYWFLT
ncbi:XRE family transcriptional regulator [Alteromonadaceae bacterium M269]|nr:XRE family transcriptional regulator [Alteromonadaceae bacterium M269]